MRELIVMVQFVCVTCRLLKEKQLTKYVDIFSVQIILLWSGKMYVFSLESTFYMNCLKNY